MEYEVKEFLDTLTLEILEPSIFVNWPEINSKLKELESGIRELDKIKTKDKNLFKKQLREAIEKNPKEVLGCLKLLIGHTPSILSFGNAKIDFEKYEIGDSKKIVDLFLEIDIQNLLVNSTSVKDMIKGSLIGLYPNTRKNIRGFIFEKNVEILIRDILNKLKKYKLSYEKQEVIELSKGPKKIDFTIVRNHRNIIAIETNFYSAQGSKPSETIRAYEELQNKLKERNIKFILISDGAGWLKMKKLTKIAFEKIENFMNYNQARNKLEEIILKSFNV